ncbi:MAG: aminomethyl transferase family protein [Pseudomonadota bacterium]
MNRTPLFDWHVSQGAVMTEFRGWEMPLWYSAGAVAEHRAVVTAAGLFDTSHMSVVVIKGPGAFNLLQKCFTRDLPACTGGGKKPLRPGASVFGAYLNEAGGVVDDTILYRADEQSYISIVNCGMGEAIRAHLIGRAGGEPVEVSDLTGKVGKIDLQGPSSAKILAKVLDEPMKALDDMKYFSFKGHFDGNDSQADTRLKDGTPILLSRTGYTGEFGFEILLEPERLLSSWKMIMDAGKDFGAVPCGLAARDSLRAGAVLPLSGQDIGPWPFVNHPWPYALPYTEDKSAFTKKFIGDEALLKNENAPYTHAVAGYDPRKVSTRVPAVVLDCGGREIGTVLTCTADMAVGWYEGRILSLTSPGRPQDFKPKGLMCGLVKVKSRLSPGEAVVLQDRKRKIKAVIVEDVRPDRTALRPMHEML